MRTSCALGASTSTSSIERSLPASQAIAAFWSRSICSRRYLKLEEMYLAGNGLSICMLAIDLERYKGLLVTRVWEITFPTVSAGMMAVSNTFASNVIRSHPSNRGERRAQKKKKRCREVCSQETCFAYLKMSSSGAARQSSGD